MEATTPVTIKRQRHNGVAVAEALPVRAAPAQHGYDGGNQKEKGSSSFGVGGGDNAAEGELHRPERRGQSRTDVDTSRAAAETDMAP